MAAVALPAGLMKLADILDNPWHMGMDKAKKAGVVLADVLSKRVAGSRPVTLVGFSLGARVIFHALLELASRKVPVHGVVEDVYLFGAPVTVDMEEWARVRSVVAGRLINGYATSDWVLSFLYRSLSASQSVAGLGPVHLPATSAVVDANGVAAAATEVGRGDVENVDLSDLVDGHLSYRLMMPHILYKVGLSTTEPPTTEEVEAMLEAKKKRADEAERAKAAEHSSSRDMSAQLVRLENNDAGEDGILVDMNAVSSDDLSGSAETAAVGDEGVALVPGKASPAVDSTDVVATPGGQGGGSEDETAEHAKVLEAMTEINPFGDDEDDD